MISRILVVMSMLALTGCGATPAFLGDATDGNAFIARLTEFRGGASPIVGAGIDAEGCQLSMRGEVPRGVVATLLAGSCRADVTYRVEFESAP